MAKKTLEELIADFKAVTVDSADDAVINFMEDLTDSMTADGEDWKTKYEENDAAWRQRYKDRFSEPAKVTDDDVSDETEIVNFEDLFEEEK